VSITLFFLVTMATGLVGYAVLVRFGLDDAEAWATGRAAGLMLLAMSAFWAGAVGVARWQLVAQVVLVIGTALAAVVLWQRRAAWRAVVSAELVCVAATAVFLLLRLGTWAIRGQEKPMDLAILATLLRGESLPPPDMWLAGTSLPYYYWGSLVWVTPLKLSGVDLGIGYNLVVAQLAGIIAVTIWAVGRRVSGSASLGVLCVWFALFAGTPDGFFQLVARRSLAGVDLWHASRQIPGTITEFPLFTAWLGDLHPHFLSIPFACLTLLLAMHASGRQHRPRGALLVATGCALGVTWAANPWAMPPTVAAVGVLLLGGEVPRPWPWLGRGAAVVETMGVTVVGFVVTAPFHLQFHPPFAGLGLVREVTHPYQLALYAACLLVPVGCACVRLLAGWFGGSGVRALAPGLGLLAVMVLAASLASPVALVLGGLGCILWAAAVGRTSGTIGQAPPALLLGGGLTIVLVLTAMLGVVAGAVPRPSLVLLASLLVVLTVAAATQSCPRRRHALALAGLGVLLLAVPEVVFVRDCYGEELHRMNTVFKAYIQAWVLLAVALPVMLELGCSSRLWRRVLVAGMLVVSLPHLLAVIRTTMHQDELRLDGLAWMEAGDRQLVEQLRRQPLGCSFIEAVGDAYSDFARLSAASGVPCYLGWANHESVWRGATVGPELTRRRQLVDRLYAAVEPETVQQLVAEAGVDLVAVGSLERAVCSEATVAALRSSGEVVYERGGTMLVRPRVSNRQSSPRKGGVR